MIVNPYERSPGVWTCRSEDGKTFADSEDKSGDWGHHLDENEDGEFRDSAAIVVRNADRVIALVVSAEYDAVPSKELVANAFVIAAADQMFAACAAWALAHATCSHLGRCDCYAGAGDLILAALEKAKGGAA